MEGYQLPRSTTSFFEVEKDMPANPSVRRFLDVEAREDDNDDILDSEEEEDLNDPFLDDGLESTNPSPTHSTPIPRPNARESALDTLIEKIMATQARSKTSRLSDVYEEEGLAVGNAVPLSLEGDYPLWRIKCRIGTEEIAVLSLLSTAGPSHHLRSAFTRGSVRGSIYLECTMCPELVSLLKKTPGVIRSHQGVHRQVVDSSEHFALLRMRNGRVEVEVGDWVLVTRGLYGGDVGVVGAVHSWGVRLLLIPRLDIPRLDIISDDSEPSEPSSRKRKATPIKPVSKLFHPSTFSSSSVRIIPTGENSYSMGLSEFEHGLVAKEFDFHSFRKDLKDIPHSYHRLFVESRHPCVILSQMPRPWEWVFKENDSIVLLSTGASAKIKSMEVYYAEIEHSNPTLSIPQWTERVSWNNIRKDIKVGQYVRANSGPHTGIAGWVVDLKGDVATLTTKVLEGRILQHDDAVKFIDVFVNYSEITEPPVIHQTQQAQELSDGVPAPETPNPLTQRAARHPWCGLEVKISRKSHPKKGETGVIKEVMGQENGDGSDIKLSIQLTQYNPSAPFQTIQVAYRDVVELKSLNELVVSLDPGPGFCRPRPHPINKLRKIKLVFPPIGPVELPSGAQTPLPLESEVDRSGSFAWDPRSRNLGEFQYLVSPFLCDNNPPWEREWEREWGERQTPASDLSHGSPLSPLASSSSSTSTSLVHASLSPVASTSSTSTSRVHASSSSNVQPPKPTHVLLNPSLVGVSLNVVVNGGEFSKKDLVASVSVDAQGAPTLRYTRYNTSTLLNPDWVVPKHPNPTHDNGLLVVIKGEHSGKYVRRIHHRRENGSILIILAVVTRSDGLPDVQTGERLELAVEFLATVTEAKKQKDLNWNVMHKTREDFRKNNR